MPQSAYGDIGRTGAAHVVAKALLHAEPSLILQRFGLSQPMPKNKGEKISFRRPRPFAPVTAPLVEGVTPTAKQFLYDRVEGTLSQFGDLAQITDKANDLAEDPVLNECAEMMGEQAGLSMELQVWGVLRGGTNVFYAEKANASRNQVKAVITPARQQAITQFLKKQKGQKHTSVLQGTDKVGTRPIEASYIAVGHTDLENDIRNMAGFVPVSEYSHYKPVCEQEIGAVRDTRYVLSPELEPFLTAGVATASAPGMKATAGFVDVYPVIFLAKHAFGVVPLAGGNSLHPTIINPGRIDKSDPLGQRGYAGWKSYFLCLRLNEFWMARLEVACTDL